MKRLGMAITGMALVLVLAAQSAQAQHVRHDSRHYYQGRGGISIGLPLQMEESYYDNSYYYVSPNADYFSYYSGTYPLYCGPMFYSGCWYPYYSNYPYSGGWHGRPYHNQQHHGGGRGGHHGH